MQPSKQSGYAPVNGLNMYYEIHGTASKVLVLIHGGGSTIESSFGKLLPLLSSDYKVIAMELQAHGRTSDRPVSESFTQDADDVAALLDHLHITKASFLGYSNGGSTTMQIAIRHPELVDKMIVLSAAYKREGFIPGFFENMPKATLDNMPEPLKVAYLKVNKDENGLLNMFNKDKERMVNFKDWKDEDLKRIKAKTLIASADHDVATPEHAIKMAQLIPGARLLILPGDHASLIGEACDPKKDNQMPGLFASLVKEFLHE